jgi:hypothetical protein
MAGILLLYVVLLMVALLTAGVMYVVHGGRLPLPVLPTTSYDAAVDLLFVCAAAWLLVSIRWPRAVRTRRAIVGLAALAIAFVGNVSWIVRSGVVASIVALTFRRSIRLRPRRPRNTRRLHGVDRVFE